MFSETRSRYVKSQNSESGFTLVELLVVILIIGVLAAIAIPAFMNQRERAADASLESDLRNAAAAVVTSDLSPEKFRGLAGGRQSAAIVHPDMYAVANPNVLWNEVEGASPIQVSPSNMLEVAMRSTSSGWWTTHDPGEFCLAGRGDGSQYNYVPGSGEPENYDRHLFFDVKMGGVVTLSEIAEALQNGKEVSCDGFAGNWLHLNEPGGFLRPVDGSY